MRRLGALTVLLGALAAQAQQGREVTLSPSPPISASPELWRTPRLRANVDGWTLTGTNVSAYEIKCDVLFDCSVPVLRSKAGATPPFGMASLTHVTDAEPYRGTRVRLSAEVKAARIDGWGGLWMRTDAADGRVLAFDNMQNRALTGTSPYVWQHVVLDIPADADRISLGVMLHGPGALLIREVKVEIVNPAAVASTDLIGPLRAQALSACAP